MKEYFAKLSSMERRFVVGVLMLVFLILNAWLIWPRFGDWKKNQTRMKAAQDKLKLFQDKIATTPQLQEKVRLLESEGASVPPEDQAIDFVSTIQRQAAASAVVIQTMNRIPPRSGTNQFFVEVGQSLKLQAGEEQLVDFLYKLGAGNSLVRVRGLSLGPDAPRYNLRVDVTLVGSYQKKPAARAAAVAATMPRPAAAASGVPQPSPSSKK